MAFNLFGGKRRITKGFFANSLGNKQTRGIYTFQIDVENGELIFKKILCNTNRSMVCL